MEKIPNADLHRKTVQEFKEANKLPIVIVLDNIRSLHNVGSVFRTADAFLLQAIYLCGVTGIPPNKEIEKTALGSTQTVEWVYCKTTQEAIEDLKQKNYLIYSVEQVKEAQPLQNVNIDKQKKYAFVFGNEVYGVDQEIINQSDGCIEIPQLGTKHSLNISVSTGIVLWEVTRGYR